VNRSQNHGYDRHHRQFDDLSWLDRGSPGSPFEWYNRSMSPEELRQRLERAGLTPYRLSYLLGVEPNEGSKWTRRDGPFRRAALRRLSS
jgi:hypothetical protein